jgi:hypothetical protein
MHNYLFEFEKCQYLITAWKAECDRQGRQQSGVKNKKVEVSVREFKTFQSFN